MSGVSRRTVMAGGAAATLAVGVGAAQRPPSNAARFSLKFAPHEGSFASRGGRIEQIAYAADQGFRAWEDNEAGFAALPSRRRWRRRCNNAV